LVNPQAEPLFSVKVNQLSVPPHRQEQAFSGALRLLAQGVLVVTRADSVERRRIPTPSEAVPLEDRSLSVNRNLRLEAEVEPDCSDPLAALLAHLDSEPHSPIHSVSQVPGPPWDRAWVQVKVRL
jgi:hypothetical protein